MALLHLDDRQLLWDMLARSHRISTAEDRQALLAKIGVNTGYIDIAGTNVTFATNLVSQLNHNGHRQALIKLVNELAKDRTNAKDITHLIRLLKWSTYNENLENYRSSAKALHILSSGKGGVGKTLIALASICGSAVDLGHNLLGVDLNTMNPDLFRLLSFESFGQLQWERSSVDWMHDFLNNQELEDGTIDWENQLSIVNLIQQSNPFILPKGIQGFWLRIIEGIGLDPAFQDYEIFVDTNLNILNLFSDTETIHRLLRTYNNKIYVWIFWTWASIHDGGRIARTLTVAKREFGENLQFVHVLNPSALLSPRVDISNEVNNLTHLRKAIEALGPIKSMNPVSEMASTLYELLIQQEKIVFDEIDKITNPAEYEIGGLLELTNAPSTESISHDTFISILEDIAPFTLDGEQFIEFYVALDNQRPLNVLPISTHDPELRGYTEDPDFGQNIRQIYHKMVNIRKDIVPFLKALR